MERGATLEHPANPGMGFVGDQRRHINEGLQVNFRAQNVRRWSSRSVNDTPQARSLTSTSKERPVGDRIDVDTPADGAHADGAAPISGWWWGGVKERSFATASAIL